MTVAEVEKVRTLVARVLVEVRTNFHQALDEMSVEKKFTCLGRLEGFEFVLRNVSEIWPESLDKIELRVREEIMRSRV